MYVSTRRQVFYGERIGPGERIPRPVVERLPVNRLHALLSLNRVKWLDDAEKEKAKPVYRGRGWWQLPSGEKVRGSKDEPPEV